MIYENVLAGSFIYGLGVVAGRNSDANETTLDSINFFQQTPHDKKIGDLLADWGGKTFLVEFKRTVSQLKDEVAKDGKPELGSKIAGSRRINILSERCHFIGYGKYVKQNKDGLIKTSFLFQTYFSLLTRGKSTEHSLSAFIKQMKSNRDFGLASREDFNDYLDFLLKHAEAKPATTTSGKKAQKPISGILTGVSPKGEVVTIGYQSYQHLAYLMGQKVNLLQNLVEQISFTNAPVIGKSINNEKSQGFGIGG